MLPEGAALSFALFVLLFMVVVILERFTPKPENEVVVNRLYFQQGDEFFEVRSVIVQHDGSVLLNLGEKTKPKTSTGQKATKGQA